MIVDIGGSTRVDRESPGEDCPSSSTSTSAMYAHPLNLSAIIADIVERGNFKLPLTRPVMPLTFSRVDSPIVDMEIWSAVSDGFSFAISYESRNGPGLRGQAGFMASWRSLSRVNMGAVRIAGSPLATLEEAEQACAVVLDYLTEGKKV